MINEKGYYAVVEKNGNRKIFGDTGLIQVLQSKGFIIDHLGWGDFLASKGDISITFTRYSDIKRMKDQVGRCHILTGKFEVEKVFRNVMKTKFLGEQP